MNVIFKCSSRASLVALLQIIIVATAFSCDSDSSVTEEDECSEIGETESCDDVSGNPGYKVCLPDGVYTECMYEIPTAGQPCSDLGEEFACACGGRLNGNIYCLNDRVYSECFCDSSSSSPMGSAGSSGQDSVSDTSDSSDACPAPFSCVELAQAGTVNKLCVEGGMPPLCESNPDCDAAGLDEAQCLDIGVGTKICVQACN